MTGFETRLQRAFAAHASPATDPLFRVHIIMRQRRAALRRQLAEMLGFGCGSAVLAVLVIQTVDEVVESTGVRLLATAIVAMGYVAVLTQRYVGVPSFLYFWSARVRSVIWRH